MGDVQPRHQMQQDIRAETKEPTCCCCQRGCKIFIAILIVLLVLAAAGVLIWYFLFRVKEVEIPANVKTPAFYTNNSVTPLPVKVGLTLTFPANMLSHLAGKQQVAIVFVRTESDVKDATPFQIAMISMNGSHVQLKALVPTPPYLVRNAFPLEFYFEKYPLQLRIEIAYGAIEGGKFLWAASSSFTWTFSSTSSQTFQQMIMVMAPNKLANLLLTAAVKTAMLTNGWQIWAITMEYKVTTKLDPLCGTDYYGSFCSVKCVGKNSTTEGHYSCDMNGNKVCLPGWKNVSNNCLDRDHCHNVTCNNGGTCQDTGSSFNCLCTSGFNGTFCENDINECVPTNPCKNGGSCFNTVGSFRCTCTAAFTGQLCDVDVNECVTIKPCQNGGVCTNTRGGYTCRCPAPYTGTTCATRSHAHVIMPTEITHLIILSVLSVMFL